jgi:site-specific DNA-methyltransferase (adenine-specific)
MGNSADHVLCDPEIDGEFVAVCRKKGLVGDAFTWNRLLLRIRKSGRLPRLGISRKRLTFEMMDAYSYASEIAMHLMSLNYACSLDDILCSPRAALDFDQLASEFAPGFSPFEYRWAALSIRKRATQSKMLAKERFSEWLTRKRLPNPVPLSRFSVGRYKQPGVYILARSDERLYVGETFNLGSRIEQTLSSTQWMRLNPESVIVLEQADRLRQHGLQSALIARTRPRLNSQLLRPDVEHSSR